MRKRVCCPAVCCSGWLLALLMAGIAGLAGLPARAVAQVPAGVPAEPPLDAAVRFVRAFETRDFATVRSLLADDATIVRVSLSRTAAPQVQRFSARAWADEAERNHAYLRDLRLDLLETSESRVEPGAVVSLRYRFTGKAGSASFVSDGIDTYALIPVDGRWRVLQYSYIERLEMQPAGGKP